TLGRWLSRDPLEESEGINLYAYCYGDPINLRDPYGLAAPIAPPTWGGPYVNSPVALGGTAGAASSFTLTGGWAGTAGPIGATAAISYGVGVGVGSTPPVYNFIASVYDPLFP